MSGGLTSTLVRFEVDRVCDLSKLRTILQDSSKQDVDRSQL